MTQWTNRRSLRVQPLSTSTAISYSLTAQEGGVAECAQGTAGNAVDALGRLAEMLEGKGLLTTAEVQQVFQIYAYESAEDE